MSDKRLFDIWAWSQIEAAADGSLDGESLQRMREAQERDPRLRAAIERARTLHGALRVSGRKPPPRGLLGALLAIPQRHPRARADGALGTARGSIWATGGGAVAAAALAAVVVANLSMPSVSQPPRVSATAVSEPPVSEPPVSELPVSEPLAPPTAEASPPAFAAAQDLALALAYMNKSAEITGREIGAALNGGFTAAFEVSRDSLSRRTD